jgi:DNA-binding NarL/FixJ family response regulator
MISCGYGAAGKPRKEGGVVDRIRVLLAEDHAIVREGTREFLDREEDLEVLGEAGDGREAVRLALALAPDVVVMDIAMPVLNGVEATKRIKKDRPGTAVLILTAYDDDQYVFALLEAGAAGYLLKTVRGAELVEAIRLVASGEAVLHPTVARKVIDRLADHPDEGGRESEKPELTEREMGVLELAARGMTNKAIARELVLSVRTVQSHLNNIFNKLVVGSRTEAVLYALRKGWFSLEDTL